MYSKTEVSSAIDFLQHIDKNLQDLRLSLIALQTGVATVVGGDEVEGTREQLRKIQKECDRLIRLCTD